MSRTARALAALLVAGGVVASVSSVYAGTSSTSRALAEVRRATARYHDPSTALAEGYVAAEHCVEDPQLGGMGLHYLNPALLADPAIDPTRPEVVIYEMLPGGRLRFVAVEWFAVDPDQDLSTEEGRPSLFGIPFDGPMPGHEPGMPVHFDLHAWIWKHNPAGTFAPWNPTVDCAPTRSHDPTRL
ncbi:MAG: hypothetical protein M3163_00475 [Actinomycetota bacterium]|nr:hypothetical protein [Actinomycetota bacterium]